MDKLIIVLQSVLALAFLATASVKLIGVQFYVEAFDRFGYPQWLRMVAGLVEVLGALGMIVGIFYPVWAILAGLLVAVTLVGAFASHLRVHDPLWKLWQAPLLCGLSLVVVATHAASLGLGGV